MKRTKIKNRILPDYTLGEEIFNAISHGIGILLGIIVCVLCALKTKETPLVFIGCLVYGVSMIILYCFSTLYHSLPCGKGKKVLQILDHCTIYILIAGTYTPILLGGFLNAAPTVCWILFGIQWGVSVIAITLNAIDLHKFRYFSYFSYIILGWAIIFVCPIALRVLSPTAFLYILAGGIGYTIGAILYAIGNKHRWFHSIFHVFVVIGSILQFIGIYCYIL